MSTHANDSKNEATKKIVTFGEVMLRLTTLGRKKLIQSFPGQLETTFGGAEANVAVSLAILGNRKVTYVTALPKNDMADACINQLRSFGIDTSKIYNSEEGRLGIYFLETGANQRPSKVVYDRAFSSIALADKERFAWNEIFSGANYFHITGITPSLSKIAAETSLYAVQLAKKHGLKVSCDLNFRKKLWNWEPGISANELAKRTMTEILNYVDIVIANEEDAADVLGIHAPDTDVTSGKIDNTAYEYVAKEIATKFKNVSKIAITLRESISATHNNWGAMLYDTELQKSFYAPVNANGHYAPYQITSIVDRVGGGDSFGAGLLYALSDYKLYENAEAIKFAVAASCLAHSIEGDFNYSSLKEVLTLMKGNASGRVQR